MADIILPNSTIGIIGGGQLGRMMCIAAKAMGYKVAILDPTPNCPAAQVADTEITAPYDDIDSIKKLAHISDVITYEFENIDYEALIYLETAAYLPQRSDVLKITQHRYMEKSAIESMGLPVADFFYIDSIEALEKNFFYPSVIKSCSGGYDGKGQIVIRGREDFAAAKGLAEKHECILEKLIPFDREISVITARSTGEEISVFPVAENIHINNILHHSIVPARISRELEARAIEYALTITKTLNVIGVMAVEMFVVEGESGGGTIGGGIYINELAPRPHNSGHYTIDACITSQFEQHIRAVCGLPLGDTSLHSPVVMVNILGEHLGGSRAAAELPGLDLEAYLPLLERGKLHLYGKAEARAGRKMGHINMLGDPEEILKLINETKIWSGGEK